MSILKEAASPIELWGGMECTYNRVGDFYMDQLALTGFEARLDDLERFVELGIRVLRFPVLWERLAPTTLEKIDWRWVDERIHFLKHKNVKPLVTFVHHGSGPRHTHLLDPEFADKLTRFCEAFIDRFPDVELFNPLNEPLTTARFSGLYGIWYPHEKNDKAFFRALVNECRAIAQCMNLIRSKNPGARHVQSEDLGKVTSTPLLAYQAEFENERRWLSLDLLSGGVDSSHYFWKRMISSGLREDEILWFKENSKAPDIIGINHYLTSNRHLDENLSLYPNWSHGGNNRHQYADVESVRVGSVEPVRWQVLLQEAWQRYHRPLAITEVHVHCTREEQMRWLRDAWNEAHQAREDGVDVRALTVWSLLGTYNWARLCTVDIGHYESGVFDLRSEKPRPTALVPLVKSLSQGKIWDHPVLQGEGWWKRPVRSHYPPYVLDSSLSANSLCRGRIPILITGKTGTLGQAFARICEYRDIAYALLGRRELDIADHDSVEKVIKEIRPWAVINTAGYVRVDDAEFDREKCFRENVQGAARLAETCAELGLPLVTFSSDLVFDGMTPSAYLESSPVRPLNVYGHSKKEAEERVLQIHSSALVIRTSGFFGPWDTYNFIYFVLRNLAARQPVVLPESVTVTPTYVPDLVNTTLDLLIDGEKGIWHLTNQGPITWFEFAKRAAERAKLNTQQVAIRPIHEMPWKAPRPINSALTSERGILLPDLEQSLDKYFSELAVRYDQ